MSDIVKILRGETDDPMYPYSTILELHRGAADEIERLEDAKRRALAIADERSKENVELRNENNQLRELYDAGCKHWGPVYKTVLDVRDKLRAELDEQARLNGMGAERELALRAELIRLRADKDAEIVRLRADQAVWVKETQRVHKELEAENERLRQQRDSQEKGGTPELITVNGDDIVIRVTLNALVSATENGCLCTFSKIKNDFRTVRVYDPALWRDAIVRALRREKENGDTPVHLMLDEALEYAADQGEEGVSIEDILP